MKGFIVVLIIYRPTCQFFYEVWIGRSAGCCIKIGNKVISDGDKNSIILKLGYGTKIASLHSCS